MNIDVEFRSVIPALSKEEYEGLEQSIVSEGCRDALITWQGILIDGHNRFEICTKHGIEYTTTEKDFANRDDVMCWIIDNQLSRRNLAEYVRYELKKKKEEILKVKGKETQGKRTDLLSTIDNKLIAKKHNTREIIAGELGWSTGKKAQADIVYNKAPEEVKEKLRANEITINQAYNDIKKEERTKEIQTERLKIAQTGSMVKPSDRWNVEQADIKNWNAPRQYDYIITDPPYPREYLELYGILAERAAEWLKPCGLLIAMCGQSYINQIYEMMSKHLDYYWTACYLTPGQPTPLRQVNVNTTWKPLLIFKKKDDKYNGKIFGDVFKSDGNDKDLHKWGQSESGMIDIVSKICLPGQVILDPFCGAGTTGIAALNHHCFFDGIDIEIENVNIARGRLHDAFSK